jgi:hypothetical protein
MGVSKGSLMRIASLAGILIAFQAPTALAADDMDIQRMATCQDSWLDWQKSDPARLHKFGDRFRAEFSPQSNDPFVLPKTSKTIAGLRVEQAFPISVGMGVGFSITVGAPFDTARKAFEKVLGKTLVKCETGDGMRTCELAIAEKRTFMLMGEDNPKSPSTLVGCYYYYEK